MIALVETQDFIVNFLYLFFFTDKSPQMNEFLSQIKSSAELGAMFETIQKDAQSSSSSDMMVMDTS